VSFDWSEYLNLAQEMAGLAVGPSSQDAKLRSAVSRAYYAAFCKARNHLRDKEGHRIPPSGDAHIYVREQFQNSTDRLRRGMGSTLNRLRIDRNKVDYDDVVKRLPSMTTSVLRQAARVISDLGRL